MKWIYLLYAFVFLGCVILTWSDMSPSLALLNLSKHWKVALANQRHIGYIVNRTHTHGYQSAAVVRGLSDISVTTKNLWYDWLGACCWTLWCQGTWSMVWLWFRLFNVGALRKVKICSGSLDLFWRSLLLLLSVTATITTNAYSVLMGTMNEAQLST